MWAQTDPAVLERAMRAVSERRQRPTRSWTGLSDAWLDGSHPLTVHVKMLRLELLNVKADLERARQAFMVDCAACGQTAHWVSGLGV